MANKPETEVEEAQKPTYEPPKIVQLNEIVSAQGGYTYSCSSGLSAVANGCAVGGAATGFPCSTGGAVVG